MATHKSLLGLAALVAALLAVATLGGVCVDARVVATRELQGSARLEAARAEIKGESDPTETETAASGGDVETAATEEPAAAIEAEPAAAEAEIADTGPKENEDAATATAEVQAELQEAGKTEEQMSESEQEVRLFALRMAASAAKATTKHSNSQHNKHICFSFFRLSTPSRRRASFLPSLGTPPSKDASLRRNRTTFSPHFGAHSLSWISSRSVTAPSSSPLPCPPNTVASSSGWAPAPHSRS